LLFFVENTSRFVCLYKILIYTESIVEKEHKNTNHKKKGKIKKNMTRE